MAQLFNINQLGDCAVLQGASCSFGVFDGVHVGHRFLINQAVDSARSTGGVSVALTFDIDPDELFKGNQFKKLQSNEDRLAMLGESGVDYVAVLSFTRYFADMEPDMFLETIFSNCTPVHMHVGSDMRFGKNGAGTVDELRAFGTRVGMNVHAHDLVCEGGQPVTSTRIRALLGEGKVAQARELLLRPYKVSGVVQPGRGQGASMGFATANVHVPNQLMVLGDGVYAGYADVDGRCSRAAISVGVSPTFSQESMANMEVHLLDYDDNLYGKTMHVEFLEFLRPMIAFADTDELIATVQANIDWVRHNIDICE